MKFLIVLLLAACRHAMPTGPVVAPTRTELAERALEKSLELDYTAPIRPRSGPEARSAALQLYVSACLAGENAACIRATLGYSYEYAIKNHIRASCRSGDAISCRYLVWLKDRWDETYASLPVTELRRGCVAGLLAECERLAAGPAVSERRLGAEMYCRLFHGYCLIAGESYLRDHPRDVARARDVLELGCQLLDEDACDRLVVAYQRGELREPVPGRGPDLHRFLCSTFQRCVMETSK